MPLPLHSGQFLERVARTLGPRPVPAQEQLARLVGKVPAGVLATHWPGHLPTGPLSGESFAALARPPTWEAAVPRVGYGTWRDENIDRVAVDLFEKFADQLTPHELQALENQLEAAYSVGGGVSPYRDVARAAPGAPGDYFERAIFSPEVSRSLTGLLDSGDPAAYELEVASKEHFIHPNWIVGTTRGSSLPGLLTFDEVQSDLLEGLNSLGRSLRKGDRHLTLPDLPAETKLYLRGVLDRPHATAAAGTLMDHLLRYPEAERLQVQIPTSATLMRQPDREESEWPFMSRVYDRELVKHFLDPLAQIPGITVHRFPSWNVALLNPEATDSLRSGGFPLFRSAVLAPGAGLALEDEDQPSLANLIGGSSFQEAAYGQ